MPKVINNLKSEYLDVARGILLSDGYKALTLRRVALACDVALGTLYNYFKNKDDLVANIMFVDWNRIINNICLDDGNGLCNIFVAIATFSNLYRHVWFDSSVSAISSFRHNLLVEQICKLVLVVLGSDDVGLGNFISEILLSYGVREDSEFSDISDYIDILIKGRKS